MSGEMLAFFILSLFIIGGAVFMISFTRVVHMVVSICFTFLSIAGLYVLLEAEFVAFSQVLIYTGAVSILMLFGIMLTRHDIEEEAEKKRSGFKFLVFIVVLVFFGSVLMAIQGTPWGNEAASYKENNTAMIGQALYQQFVIPFELVSVLLLVTLVGAIIIAKKEVDDK